MESLSPQIKAVISDLGGVLIDVDKDNMCAQMAKHSSLSKEEISAQFSAVLVSGREMGFSKGLIDRESFFEKMSRELKLDGLSFDGFNKIYSDRFTRKEDSIALLRKLAGRYPIAMLSNTNELHYEYWARLLGDDLKLFKFLVLSFEVHLAKPDPEIYAVAAKKLGVDAQSCVFIDDVESYAKAAEGVGMKGIRFVSAAKLESDLKKLGVSA